jgi:translation initiation factor IF-2
MERCVAVTLRVHTLAKELGVPSKAIIDKCRAEGIDLKNHMAALSIGLAESIREWFSTGDDITSVEVAEHVDVEVVRKARRKTRPQEADTGEVAVEVAPEPTGVAEAVPEAGEKPGLGPPEAAPRVAAEAPGAAAEVAALALVEAAAPAVRVTGELLETPARGGAETLAARAPAIAEWAATGLPQAAPAPAESAAAAAVAPATLESAPGLIELPLAAPPAELIKPAGPQVVPAPAELKGPTLVRIEAPEPHIAPRARTGLGRGVAERAPAATTGTATAAPRRGRAKGRKTEEEEAAAFRSRSPRRHGATSDVDQRLREWRDQDLLERKERLASVTGHGLRDRRAAERRRQATAQAGGLQLARKEPIPITTPVSIKDFSAAVGVPFSAISKTLFEHTGRLWTINQTLDAEHTELLALDFGIPIQVQKAKTAYEALEEEFMQRERTHLQTRPPVVAMLGHVDHGKTSLLDAIRKTRVAAGEAGGITQHIGAYRLDRGDWHVTFVDTPGHEAFTAMRARGANLTDVVVLVVAADDGVMPQTVEAIAHARAAGVPIVVALNKIDLPGIDLNRVFAGLAEQGLAPAEWGGETDLIKTSAVSGQGIDELVAHLSTLSELLELKADPTVPAQAMVIEAQMQEGRGVVAQVLVREGTLRSGQCVVCGPGAGRIRALRDDQGRQVKEASPGTPVEVSGLDELPAAGDRLYQVESLSQAKEIAEEVQQRRREDSLVAAPKGRTLEALLLGQAEALVPELNVILKADVQGSVEVLKKSLGEFPAEKARLNILHAGVGAVSEADVHLAKASGAIIIGFHVVAEERARQLADQLGVEVRQYRVIYELLDDLHRALAGLLAPLEREELRGSAEVRQIFNVSRVGVIAGCYVTDGAIARAHKVRLVRDGRIVLEGKPIASLKRFKDDAREVRAGLECGIKIQDFDDVKPNDVIQTYELVEVMQDL